MSTQKKFIKRYITWIIKPDSGYLSSIIDKSEQESLARFTSEFWKKNGYKFIREVIEIPVPKELEHLVLECRDSAGAM